MAPSPTATRAPQPTSTVLSGLTAEGLKVHLAALDRIAAEHGGTRSVGTEGFDASVDYAEGVLTTLGYEPERKAFEAPVWEDRTGDMLKISGLAPTFTEDVDFRPVAYSETAGAAGTLVVIDPCASAPFVDVRQGDLLFVPWKPDCAYNPPEGERQGAVAMIFASDAPAGEVPTYAAMPGGMHIPMVTVTSDAAALLERAAGEMVTVRVTGTTRDVSTPNLLADLPGTDPGRVVLIGAHLDSTADGPGIDDDATGVAAVLELARVLAGSSHSATIRFALWSAEELGLLGSDAYLGFLPSADRAAIDVYLNADMLGARNWIRGLYLGEAELRRSVEAGKALSSYFTDQGLEVETVPALWATDAARFSEHGIAAAGIGTVGVTDKTDSEAARFGGAADEPIDACYHEACDTLANVDLGITLEMTRALGSALVDLARE